MNNRSCRDIILYVDMSKGICIYIAEYCSFVLELELCDGNIPKSLINFWKPLVAKYHEGKMKRTLERELKSMRISW